MHDEKGTPWIVLKRYCDTGFQQMTTDKLLSWCWTYGHFVTEEQADEMWEHFNNGGNIENCGLTNHIQTYSVFNREYPWAPSCADIRKWTLQEVELDTGEEEKKTENCMLPDLLAINELLGEHGSGSKTDRYNSSLNEERELINNENRATLEEINNVESFTISFVEKSITRQIPIKKSIGKVLTATVDLLWEEQYDASKEDSISWTVPCPEIIDDLQLQQMQADCFYYDKDNQLAAFDTKLINQKGGFVIRKDLLDQFLQRKNLQLLWLIDGAKEVHAKSLSIDRWSDWAGVLIYNNGVISGDIRMISSNP